MNLKRILKDQFGYKKFRDNQEDIIKAVLDGRDVFAAMPTGGGKSICYQLPSIVFDGLSIVVSPLVALMKDQVDEAVENGLNAAFINSSLSPAEAQAVYSDLFKGRIKLLYLSPERLSLDGYYEKLRDLPVKFFAVDEAHCLSEWGHDFRPDYLNLSRIKKYFPDVPVAAFTATATIQVQNDIINLLKLVDPYTVRASFNRPELFYRVEQKNGALDQITAFIRDHGGQAGIVYRTSRKDVEKTADYLVSKGIKARAYHAGLPQKDRQKCQDAFNRDKIDVICATIAFGMGINKMNVRFVVHGDLPRSMEGYYQETGRAGRDGAEAHCLLLYSGGDMMKIQYHINNMHDGIEKKKAEANLRRMSSFASVNVCRRKQLLEYFDEPADEHCGFCDICTDKIEKINASVDAQKVMSAVVRTGERFGIVHVIDVVCGADTEKIRKFGHEKLKTYGAGSDKPKSWWRSIVDDLIRQDAVYQDAESYNAVKLNPKGREILYGREPFYILKKEVVTVKTASKSLAGLGAANYDEALYAILREYRNSLAADKNIPSYIIFSDRSLKDMCIIKPVDNSSFLRVHGVGEKKLSEYGPLFIPKIREYLGY
ncbi:MAG: DNA helicase RecQ [Spirochaetales bacterium]|uniref:DNA helicase RecQ n=1 Tax=Candidatus Thalassospirochaeta sargassi TaxID=3119039 RepID=A0AAJ1MHF3_9SPIO|nr:DNA helicase RecQ [Spirochaetales bacterium]